MEDQNLNVDLNTEETQESAPSSEQESYSKEEVSKLLKALHTERDARKAQEKALKESTARLQKLEDVDPDLHKQLLQDQARRAELDAEMEVREAERQRNFEQMKQEASTREGKLQGQINHMQRHRAFEGLFSASGGKGGKFLDTAFDAIGNRLRLETDGSFTVLDVTGDPLLDDESGKRVDPKEWVQQYKSDDFLGFCFEPEQGYGAGATSHPSQRRDTGTLADFQGLSTTEIFARTFGRK